ncbi:hypothetical protein K1X76_00245 [bacterium]|nr:hypothetical protein [bacterium]
MISGIKSGNNYALNALHRTNKKQQDNFNQLSTGKRVTKGADDPLALTKIGKLVSDYKGLETSLAQTSSAQDTVNIASGGLSSVLENLQNLRTVALQAADDNASSSDRRAFETYKAETLNQINATAGSVNNGSQNLLDGTYNNRNIQVGPNAGETVNIDIEAANTSALHLTDLDFSSASGAQSAIESIDQAIGNVLSSMSDLGSKSNRLDAAYESNQSKKESIASAKSEIEDLDYAKALTDAKALDFQKRAVISLLSTLNSSASTLSKLV